VDEDEAMEEGNDEEEEFKSEAGRCGACRSSKHSDMKMFECCKGLVHSNCWE
jgi:hypothetical protein